MVGGDFDCCAGAGNRAEREVLVEKVANAVGRVRWHRHGLKPLPTDEEIARAALKAIAPDPRP